jgi:hypothetical protein
VDVGGKHPKFRRADIERIKAEGISVLKKIGRQPRASRAPRLPVEVEPLESMLARAKQSAKAARERDKRERATLMAQPSRHPRVEQDPAERERSVVGASGSL